MSLLVLELPEITRDNFEEHLSSDQTFIEFFNDFLQLPVFGDALRYDGITAGFELLDQNAADLSRLIRTSLHQLQSKTPFDPNWLPDKLLQDNRYTVTCLDRDQTLQWLKRDRLLYFLQSDCYFEYRLAKCLSEFSGQEKPEHHTTEDDGSPPHIQLCDQCYNQFCLCIGSSNVGLQEALHNCTANGRVEVKNIKHNSFQQNLTQRQTALSQSLKTAASGARQRFLAFKSFLVGGQGEKILSLWMDVERLKTLKTQDKSRYVGWIRSQYLLSSSSVALNTELLSRLGLNSTICWQEDLLCLIQPRLLEILMLYWGQRLSDQWQISNLIFSSACGNLRTRRSTDLPAHVYFPICAGASVLEPRPSCVYSDKKVDSSEIASLMEVLRTETSSGFVFTCFCQTSGKQLWENAVHFCSDLLQYRKLFYQGRFDPYRVQRTAQLLYDSYLCSGAQMSVELSEENHKYVLAHLSPAFEDLFDEVEEHVFTVLLEPWRLLSAQLTESLKLVAQWTEVRYAETELFQTLQTLYTHAQRKPQQVFRAAPAEDTRAPDLWSKVPDEFRGICLDFLLCNPLELQHFQTFLEEKSASLDLQCWLDVEQLRENPASDEWLLEDRNSKIRAKYLSSNFLFGPSSRANEEQQMRLCQMVAALGCESLSELQVLLHKRLENIWLPMFLSNSKFIKRHKLQRMNYTCNSSSFLITLISQQNCSSDNVTAGVCVCVCMSVCVHGCGVQSAGVVSVQQSVSRHRRRQLYKRANAGVMGSSRVSVCLRRALLNPVTCQQFQKFLCFCGDLLENDLLFWLEVQRYKDLCHSRCDDVMVQRKVSIILNSFITSSIHPSLQIHIPPDLAQRMLSEQRSLGPYVFREAQMCVFKELLKHWPDFMAFREAVGEEKVLPMLEHNKWRERQRRETEEQDDVCSQEDKMHSVNYADMQENCGTEGMREVMWKISWCYSKHMAATESQKLLSETVTSPCVTDSLRETDGADAGLCMNHRNIRWCPSVTKHTNTHAAHRTKIRSHK